MSALVMQIRIEQLIFWRNRSGVFFTFLLPIALLFATGASSGIELALPMVLVIAIVATGVQGLTIQLTMHRDQGVLKQLRATPLTTSTYLAGKIASLALVVAVESCIIGAAAILVFGASAPDDLLRVIVSMLLGVATFTSLGFLLTSLIATSDSAPAVGSVVFLAFVALTVLAANAQSLPAALETPLALVPTSALYDGVHGGWFGAAGDASFAQVVLVLVVWTAVLTGAAARSFRWTPASER